MRDCYLHRMTLCARVVIDVVAKRPSKRKRRRVTPGADAIRAEQLRSFARRDWALVEELKRSFWIERRKRMPPAEAIRIGDELREQVHGMRPDWPTRAERDADLAAHVRLAELLDRASASRHR